MHLAHHHVEHARQDELQCPALQRVVDVELDLAGIVVRLRRSSMSASRCLTGPWVDMRLDQALCLVDGDIAVQGFLDAELLVGDGQFGLEGLAAIRQT